MFAFEWVALVYFAGLLVVALWRRGTRAVIAAAFLMIVIVIAAAVLDVGARQWLGLLYLAFGYWVPAWVAPASDTPGFEAWLTRGDARCRHLFAAASPAVVLVGDLAYLLCYPLVPLSFLVVWSAGSSLDVDRYWVAVLVSGFICYGTLPWLVSRPPRLVEQPLQRAALARGNAWVLARVSHGRNTFPSGHVAVSIAAAIGLVTVSVEAAVIAGAVALGVAVGASTGRYHYALDVASGTVVGTICGLAALMAS